MTLKTSRMKTTNKATPHQLKIVFTRAVPHKLIPEIKLVIAIMYQAMCDSIRDKKANRPARDFFYSEYGTRLIECIGLEPVWVQEMVVKHLWRPRDKSRPASPAAVQS